MMQILTQTATGRRVRESPIPDDTRLAERYCHGVGKPDPNPPPKGSRASRLKAEALADRLAHGHPFTRVCGAEMLTVEAAKQLLCREGFGYLLEAPTPPRTQAAIEAHREKGERTRDRICRALRRMGRGRLKEVSEAVGITESPAQRHLDILVSEGRVRRRVFGPRHVVYSVNEREEG